ncbi:MAG TPA: hypothetical protein DD706_07790 [Nitrospiraceae bacterium]|nr:hypothetical protein [Nitrospiraceae bacterium]
MVLSTPPKVLRNISENEGKTLGMTFVRPYGNLLVETRETKKSNRMNMGIMKEKKTRSEKEKTSGFSYDVRNE